MKILVVDDNNARLGQIAKFLRETRQIGEDEIMSARCATDALGLLAEHKLDLLLVDIMIPFRLDDSPEVESSLRLVAELTQSDTLMKPRKVLGLTAYQEAASQASDAFTGATWALIETSEISDEWLETIGKCVDYIAEEIEQQDKIGYKTDLMVLTALPSEMEAIHRLPWNWQPAEPADDTTFAVRGSIQSGGRELSVITAHAERMGMVCAAVLASKLIGIFRPRVCIMAGICAGVRERADIGDVVFADQSWDYQSGKYVTGEESGPRFEIEPHQIAVDARVLSRVDQIAADSAALNAIWKGWPNPPKMPFKVLRGPMASGSAVLADPSMITGVKGQNRKTRAIEMESYGLLLAASHAGQPRPVAVVAKSVCDFADAGKNDDYQAYACYTSAQVVKIFVDRYLQDFIA